MMKIAALLASSLALASATSSMLFNTVGGWVDMPHSAHKSVVEQLPCILNNSL
jgi:hypothetical protein